MDVAAQNAVLDALLGASKAAHMPATFDLALLDGDPRIAAVDGGGVELDATGGYARVTVANDGTTWPAAVDGVKTSATVTLAGTSTYNVEASHWALYSGTTLYFTGELDAPVSEPTDTIDLAVLIGNAQEA